MPNVFLEKLYPCGYAFTRRSLHTNTLSCPECLQKTKQNTQTHTPKNDCHSSFVVSVHLQLQSFYSATITSLSITQAINLFLVTNKKKRQMWKEGGREGWGWKRYMYAHPTNAHCIDIHPSLFFLVCVCVCVWVWAGEGHSTSLSVENKEAFVISSL